MRAHTESSHPRSLDVGTIAEDARRALSGAYASLQLLQVGRDGVILRATHAGDSAGVRPVAIKFAWPLSPAVTDSRQRFLRTAEVSARLEHPHIVPVGPVHVVDDLAWYEMPLIGIRHLADVLADGSVPTFHRIVQLLRDAARALDFAHAHGVVHGALRPSKLLIATNGDCLVNGFTLVPAEHVPHRAVAPDAVGDPAYMAPEQWRNDPACDGRVDQYALALLAYQFVTGRARVVRDATGGIEILPPEISTLRPLRPGVGLQVGVALRRALAPQSYKRFPRVSDFVDALAGDK